MYPLFIQKRELYNKYLGRFPLHAYTSGLDVLIRDRKELKLEVEVDGTKYPVKTPLVFFGNNQLQLEEMNLKIAKCAEDGQVAGVHDELAGRDADDGAEWRRVLGDVGQGEYDGHDASLAFGARLPASFGVVVEVGAEDALEFGDARCWLR